MNEGGPLHDPSVSRDLKGVGEIMSVKEEMLTTEHAALEGVVWRKFDRWLLPLCALFYLLAGLDQTNIGNARVAGLLISLNMSNYQYSMAVTVTNIPYAVIQLPSTLLLKYIGPNILLPTMAVLWGVVSATQGLVYNYPGLLACRFFLGLIEGGLFPGVALYLSLFYPRQRLQTRITTFFVIASLTGTFSGLLAAAIDEINGKGGKPGWAWIFILEGIFSSVFGVASFFLLPHSPERTRILTEKERIYVISALRQAGSVSEDEDEDRFTWVEIVRSLKSPHVLLLAPVFFFSGAILLGLAYFEPTIVEGLGYTGNQAQLMSVPPYAVASVLCVISAIVSDRYQCRGYTVIFFALLQVVGFAMYFASTSVHLRYGSLFLSVPGSFCISPSLITWVANNSAPHVRRATSLALTFIVAQLGSVFSAWLIGWLSPAPSYTSAMITLMAMAVATIVFSTSNLVYLSRQNRLKAEKREMTRKEDEPGGLGDRSAWFMYSL